MALESEQRIIGIRILDSMLQITCAVSICCNQSRNVPFIVLYDYDKLWEGKWVDCVQMETFTSKNEYLLDLRSIDKSQFAQIFVSFAGRKSNIKKKSNMS